MINIIHSYCTGKLLTCLEIKKLFPIDDISFEMKVPEMDVPGRVLTHKNLGEY